MLICTYFSFICKYQLTAHVRQVHERRYEQVCHVCAKVCHSKYALIDHLKEHTGVKDPKIQCTLCDRSFGNRSLMRKHVRRIHEEAGRVFECPECHKQLSRKHLLRNHIAYHHNGQSHKCTVCDKPFKSPKTLKVSGAASTV